MFKYKKLFDNISHTTIIIFVEYKKACDWRSSRKMYCSCWLGVMVCNCHCNRLQQDETHFQLRWRQFCVWGVRCEVHLTIILINPLICWLYREGGGCRRAPVEDGEKESLCTSHTAGAEWPGTLSQRHTTVAPFL